MHEWVKEMINLNFDILDEMQQWEHDLEKEYLLMGGCWTYGLWGMSSPYIQPLPTLTLLEELVLKWLNLDPVMTFVLGFSLI